MDIWVTCQKLMISKILLGDFYIADFDDTTVTMLVDSTQDQIIYDKKGQQQGGAFYYYKGEQGSPKEILDLTKAVKDDLRRVMMSKIKSINEEYVNFDGNRKDIVLAINWENILKDINIKALTIEDFKIMENPNLLDSVKTNNNKKNGTTK